MKKTHSLTLVAALILGLCVDTTANAATWSAADIGAVSAAGINSSGQIVGSMGVTTALGAATHAFITGANGASVLDIGTLAGGFPGGNSWATAINDAGQVVGYSGAGALATSSAFITGANGAGMVGIAGIGTSQAYGINSSGQVVGVYTNPTTGAPSAFITGANGTGATALAGFPQSSTIVPSLPSAPPCTLPCQPTPPGSGTSTMINTGPGPSSAAGINNSGQVVGNIQAITTTQTINGKLLTTQTSVSSPSAFTTGVNGTAMTTLGFLGGTASYATSINASGQVAGYVTTAAGVANAVITGTNGVMTNLGTLGGASSVAYGISNSGLVVGSSLIASGVQHAFLYDANGGGMIDLNSFITLAGGAYFTNAVAINNNGQIAAIGSNGHSYLINPVPEPGEWLLMLSGLGLLGFIARRRNEQDGSMMMV